MDATDIIKLVEKLGFVDTFNGVIYTNDSYTHSIYIERTVSLWENRKTENGIEAKIVFHGGILNYDYIDSYYRLRKEFKHEYRKLLIDSI